MANQTQIPAARVPFIDERTGLISREWYRFFINLYALSGSGTNDISLADVQVGPDVLGSLARSDENIKKTRSNQVLTWLSTT